MKQLHRERAEAQSRGCEGPEGARRSANGMRIGVIADTHGRFDARLEDLFSGVEMILHAGDIGPLRVIRQLEQIAAVVAVRGNTDRGAVWDRYPVVRFLSIGGKEVLLVHRMEDGLRAIREEQARDRNGTDIIVYGHTHRAESVSRDGVLCFNPGSGGAQRGQTRATVGILTLTEGECQGEIVRLW